MRILYDHQVFSLQNAGGASRYHYELALHLSSVPGLDVCLYLGLNGSVYPFKALNSNKTRVFSIRSTARPGLVRYALNELLTQAWTMFSGRWDVYHPTLYRAIPTVRAGKMVATHHDCTHERFPELFHDAKRIIKAKQKLFASADSIICVSESSRRDLLYYYGVDPQKTVVVYHGHDAVQREPRLSHAKKDVQRPYLLYVGSRFGYKNFTGLLHAFSESGLARDYDLLAVGGGQWSKAESDLANRLNVLGQLKLIPHADDSVLAEAYANATVFVYPSRYEGFGFPPLEAMSAGCPVAASRCSSIPEVCGDAAFYFDPDDSGAIAKTIETAVGSPQRLTKIQAGYETARRFSWPVCAEKTLRVYRSN